MEIIGKCPYCIGKTCNKCKNGKAVFTIEENVNYYTIHCNDCGFDNGGCHEDYITKVALGECVMCDSKNLIWDLI